MEEEEEECSREDRRPREVKETGRRRRGSKEEGLDHTTITDRSSCRVCDGLHGDYLSIEHCTRTITAAPAPHLRNCTDLEPSPVRNEGTMKVKGQRSRYSEGD